jgi:hypothetical protein
MWKIENNYVEPTPDEREALARALSTSVSALWPTEPHEGMPQTAA